MTISPHLRVRVTPRQRNRERQFFLVGLKNSKSLLTSRDCDRTQTEWLMEYASGNESGEDLLPLFAASIPAFCRSLILPNRLTSIRKMIRLMKAGKLRYRTKLNPAPLGGWGQQFGLSPNLTGMICGQCYGRNPSLSRYS